MAAMGGIVYTPPLFECGGGIKLFVDEQFIPPHFLKSGGGIRFLCTENLIPPPLFEVGGVFVIFAPMILDHPPHPVILWCN